MKARGVLAAALLCVVSTSHAVVVTVDGVEWDVTQTLTTYETSTAEMELQPWWGDEAKALTFAGTVTDQLGFPNAVILGPYFAFTFDTTLDRLRVALYPDQSSTFGGSGALLGHVDGGFPWSFAFATRVTEAPEPATLGLLTVGLAGIGAMRRRRTA